MKITVTTAAAVKPKEFVVKLTNPVACNAVPVPPTELKIKEAQDYILANGVKADTDAMGDVLTETRRRTSARSSSSPRLSTVNVAVTQDAKDANTADFTVNLKDPLSCKEAPAPGSALGLQPATELDGTYDTYTPIPGAGTHGCISANRAERWIHPAGGEEGARRCITPSPSLRPRTARGDVTSWPFAGFSPAIAGRTISASGISRAVRFGGLPFYFSLAVLAPTAL